MQLPNLLAALSSTFSVLALVGAPALAAAQADPPVAGPEPAPPPVLVTAVEVDMVVDGTTARVEQRVTLSNPAQEERPFELLFPLGTGTAVTGLRLSDDSKDVDGEVFEVEEAREVYRRMAEGAFDPALLEHYGEALFRARVAKVPAGGTRQIALSYTRVVDSHADLLRGHLPLTAWRRSAGPFALDIRLEVRSEHPIGTLYSPTHVVTEGDSFVTWEGDAQVLHRTFRVQDPGCTGETDFEVFYKARDEGARFDVSVLSERPDAGEDGYFLAVVRGLPDAQLKPQPRNVVFVLDRSGSMDGAKFEQARAALLYLARDLGPADRFNLVDYSKEAARFRPGLAGPTGADVQALDEYVRGLTAEGGTNIEAALRLALEQLSAHDDAGQLNQIVFLTDGMPTEGEKDSRALARIVQEANETNVRLIAFGLGFDVNSALLDRLASENRGMSEYVLPDQDIAKRIPGFLERMRSPLLLDAQLEVEGVEVTEVFPRSVGDLYGGHQLLLSGRYTGGGAAQLVLSGRTDQQDARFTFPLDLSTDTSRSNRDSVARLWATKKIGFLVDDLRLNGEDEQKIAEIVTLGTRFGILTEYTAFLAEEDTDLFAFEDNVLSCTTHFDKATQSEGGTHAVAQGTNSKQWQRAACAAVPTNCWFDSGGRRVNVGGIACTNGRTFFRRGESWIDSRLAKVEVDREVRIGTPEFFGLLDDHAWLGACVARTGNVTLDVGGRTVHVH